MKDKDAYTPTEEGLTRYLRRQICGNELVNRSKISSITVLLTYRCPAACDHCIFESDSTRTETLNIEVARKFIEAAARQDPPPSLSFSGGEPFLQREMLRELACYAQTLGMPCEVISSGAWAKTPEFAHTVLSDLADCGLRTYCMSVDRYHLPFVSPKNLRNALFSALDVGLRVVLNTMVDPCSLGEEDAYLATALGVAPDVIARCQVNRLTTAPVGRARSNVRDFLYQNKSFREGCPFATEIVTLSPYGLLYPCCGMVLGENPHDAALFIQDNLSDRSVDEIEAILDDLKSDLFYRLLQALGPYRLLNEVIRRDPTITVRDRFVGSCDVCLEFTTNSRVAEGTRKLLIEYARILYGSEPVAVSHNPVSD